MIYDLMNDGFQLVCGLVAYLLVEQLNLKHRLSKETEGAGNDIINLFLNRWNLETQKAFPWHDPL